MSSKDLMISGSTKYILSDENGIININSWKES